MLDNEPDTNNQTPTSPDTAETAPATNPPRRRRAASRPAGPPVSSAAALPTVPAPVESAPPVKAPSERADAPPTVAQESGPAEPTAPTWDAPASAAGDPVGDPASDPGAGESAPPAKRTAKRATAKRTPKKAAESVEGSSSTEAPKTRAPRKRAAKKTAAPADGTPVQPDLLAEAAPPAEPTPPAPTNDIPNPFAAQTPAPELPAEPAAAPLDLGAELAPSEASYGSAATAPIDETAVGETPADETPADEAVAAEDLTDEALADTVTTDEDVSDTLVTADQIFAEAPGADLESTAVAETPDSVTDESDASDSDDSETDDSEADDSETDDSEAEASDDDSGDGSRRRRRRRGGRRRRRTGGDDDSDTDHADSNQADSTQAAAAESKGDTDDEPSSEDAVAETPGSSDSDDDGKGESDTQRRRRRRRRRGEDASSAPDDPTEVVVRVREPRRSPKVNNEVTGIEGSTRMEAKRQRRRDGREAGRRRPPILSEAEFLARRESVSRKMIIRQHEDLTQIAVLEDNILVEHYVDRDSAASLIGNVYLGRVQNVLPSMEAAFIDIGRGRNAVIYAGEVDWDSFGAEGQNRKVERVLKSGQTILVQVSKDPIGAKGARLTNHVSIPGRYIVYAPGGHLSGISRKLPDVERKRLRDVLADLVPESASVIVRTAAEGASEDELIRDVNRLKAQWEDIERKVASGSAPQLLYGEPDLTVRIVRDLFTEDFSELIIDGNGGSNDAYDAVDGYVTHVAPHLKERMRRWESEDGRDVFASYRLDEQIAKALERKVFLPSGGSLVIDRTEAMTVIDVNTGKFTGSGGNLEATVTSNNLEAAEEIVRQLRLRDIGGIIVIDFIDMVLPNNRELLLRRLVECLSRDRTRHQVAEVTSLGLVQMTRKKIGTGLLEAFTSECPHCNGRGVEMHEMPVESQKQADGGTREARPRDQRRGGGSGGSGGSSGPKPTEPKSRDNGHVDSSQSGNGQGGNDQQENGNGQGGNGQQENGHGDTPKSDSNDASDERPSRNRRGGRSRRAATREQGAPSDQAGAVEQASSSDPAGGSENDAGDHVGSSEDHTEPVPIS